MPKNTRKQAIDQNCKECIYDEFGEGNWRQQVTDCRVTTCSLWEWRPISKPRKKVEVENANT